MKAMAEEIEAPKLATAEIEPPITINIGNIADGAVIEAFQIELDRIVRNIVDPNTAATKKRSILLQIDFHPKDDRTQLGVEFNCTAKLAPMAPSTSRVFIGKDTDGNPVTLADDPRQMNIFTPPKPVELAKPIIFSGKK